MAPMNPGTFRINHRLLKVSFHHFDWAPVLNLARPATRWTRRARLLGLGFDICWDQSQRVYAVSFGVRRLLNLGWAYQAGPIEDYGLPAWSIQDREYVQLDLLGGEIMYSRQGLRLFFLGKKVFPLRAAKTA